MSRLARLMICPLLLAAACLTSASIHTEAATLDDVVFLSSDEPGHVYENQRPAPFLARELVRQAFLIAARDECGLLTRDTTLREELPRSSDPPSRVFVLFCSLKWDKQSSHLHYALRRRKGEAREQLWTWDLPAEVNDPEMIARLAKKGEELSRRELKTLLERNGGGKSVPPARKSATVPPEAANQLWEFNEIAVLAGLRRIHAEIRTHGESPELLAALAVGYANLGSLTEYYYSPAHKAFSARSLLYAERLLSKTEGSGWALWHRAYVRAVVGLHHLAELDVAAAKERLAKSPAPQPLPIWTSVIDMYCQGRLPQMLEQAKTKRDVRLAHYLNLEAAIYAGVGSIINQAARSVVAECPDCLRASDAMGNTGAVGLVQHVTSRAFGVLSASLVARLSKVEALPESIAKKVVSVTREVEDEVDFRQQLVAQMKAETAAGRDQSEPSLATLGQIIEEIEFAQLIGRLQFEANVSKVSTVDTVAAFRPLCAHHRYAGLIDTFGKKPAQIREAITAMAGKIESSELGYVWARAFRPLRPQSDKRIAAWLKIVNAHADPVFGDEILGLTAGASAKLNDADKPKDKQASGPDMEMLWRTSSRLPAAVAARIAHDWRHARPEAAAIESQFANDFVVMTAITLKYLEVKQFEDAARCAKHRIQITPNYGTYLMLATIYEKQGDMVRWEQTLLDALKLASLRSDELKIRGQLARYHMDRKEWKAAAGYADEAAANDAPGALLTAALCHEMLGEWTKSEALMRATSERDPASAFEWMLWCYRTGHGDVPAADDCARKQFESIGSPAPPRVLDQIGAYYLLRKELEKSLVVFGISFRDGHNPYCAMHAALIADTLGKSAERDDDLKKIVAAAKNQKPTSVAGVYGQLARLMQQVLPPGNVMDFDFKQVDSLIQAAAANSTPGDTNLAYFVGLFLKNRGAADQSRDYLIRCAQTSNYRRHTYALACQWLRDMKIPVPPAATAPKPAPKK